MSFTACVPRTLSSAVGKSRVLSILGSTGSIGRQTLEVADEEGFSVASLSCGRNVKLLAEQIRRWHPVFVSVMDGRACEALLPLMNAGALYRRACGGAKALADSGAPFFFEGTGSGVTPLNPEDDPLTNLLAGITGQDAVPLSTEPLPDVIGEEDVLFPVCPGLPVIATGRAGLCRAASLRTADTVVGAVMGFAGLEPVLAAASCGKKIALANKESLVVAGHAVRSRAGENGAWILPVDSEHSALWQCALAAPPEALRRVILTCSGGPFFGKTVEELERVTVRDALAHPVWSMGSKITIDSATLMNKGFEVIEACHLYGVSSGQVDVVIHPQGIVHSFVEFRDGALLAQLGIPDMKLPIRYALTFPERSDRPPADRLDLLTASQGRLCFSVPDERVFPAIRMARDAFRKGGCMPLVLNAANEAAVRLFLDGQIRFMAIFRLIDGALREFNHMAVINDPSFDAMMAAHHEVAAEVVRRAEKINL